jgi:signal transduction histidine kinase
MECVPLLTLEPEGCGPPMSETSNALDYDVQQLSTITDRERDTYLDYGYQRRRQILQTLIPAFLLLAVLALLAVTAFLVLVPGTQQAREGLLSIDGLMLALITLLALALLAVRLARLELGAVLVAAASAVGTAGSVAIWSRSVGLDPFAMIELTPFSVVIVLAGLFGNVWAILGATALMNLLTILLLLVVPRGLVVDATMRHELPLIVPVALVHQWVFAALMIAIWFVFQRTLRSLGTAYERAQQLDRLKNEFIASVNHELRTPLMTMQSYLETMRTQWRHLPPEQIALALDQVCRVEDALVELVKSILSTRQIDQEVADLTRERVNIREVLDMALDLVQPHGQPSADSEVHPPRELYIDVPRHMTVWSDRLRLQQILTNLLSNAVKYSPPSAPIEVHARLVQNEPVARRPWRRSTPPPPPLVEIRVRDYGQGIPPEQIPLLFNRFVRLPRDLASNIMGTGLGLYLCRVLTAAMGGQIWVESRGVMGDGATFVLRLPSDARMARQGESTPLAKATVSATDSYGKE